METKETRQDSLRQFFGPDKVNGFKKGLADFMTSKEYKGIRDEAASKLSTIKWPGAVDKIAAQADAVLDFPVSQALKGVYAKSNVLNRYLDRDKYDPEEVVLVELAEHTINSTHAPQLDIVINEQSIGALKFDIQLTLKMKGLILKIQDAKIKAITPGACKGSGKITFHGKVLAKKESEEITLLGPMDLGVGIPITP